MSEEGADAQFTDDVLLLPVAARARNDVLVAIDMMPIDADPQYNAALAIIRAAVKRVIPE